MSLDRGAVREARRQGSPTRHQKFGETDLLDFVRHLRTTAPTMPVVPVHFSTIARLSEGVEAMSGGLFDDCPAGA